VLMGAAAYGAQVWLATVLPGAGWYSRMLRVFAAIGIGIVVLLLSARLLGIAELREAMNRVVRRVVRR
jgi:hypothetical protein